MNGFVIFERDDAADRFVRSFSASDEHLRPRFIRSSRQPLFTFRGLSARDLDRIRELAEELGGSVKESVKYAPL